MVQRSNSDWLSGFISGALLGSYLTYFIYRSLKT
jgi:hypothetical protein